MSLTPVTRRETFLNAASTGGETPTPITREEQFLQNIAEAVKAATPTKTTVSGATPSITAANNTIYTCGEVTSLTVEAAANIDFAVIFVSGSTAATLTMDENIVMPDDFSVEANTRYEINVSNGYAVVGNWTVSSGD